MNHLSWLERGKDRSYHLSLSFYRLYVQWCRSRWALDTGGIDRKDERSHTIAFML